MAKSPRSSAAAFGANLPIFPSSIDFSQAKP
jgi:hypothetical protein